MTYSVLDFVEDKVTSSGTVAMAILGLSIPLSFLLNLWAVGGLAEVSGKNVVHAAVISALISPFSAMVWLTLYVNVVGYERIGSAVEPSNIPLSRTPSIASRNR